LAQNRAMVRLEQADESDKPADARVKN
jgi:hypothetical protein